MRLGPLRRGAGGERLAGAHGPGLLRFQRLHPGPEPDDLRRELRLEVPHLAVEEPLPGAPR